MPPSGKRTKMVSSGGNCHKTKVLISHRDGLESLLFLFCIFRSNTNLYGKTLLLLTDTLRVRPARVRCDMCWRLSFETRRRLSIL